MNSTFVKLIVYAFLFNKSYSYNDFKLTNSWKNIYLSEK
jgi:hypothetical protein